MSKKFAFTICSINYLSQAKALADSLKKHNSDYRFVVGLCDKLDGRDVELSKLGDLEIVEVHTIGIEGFSDMCERYDITELNTAVKPYYIDYFFRTYPDMDTVIYFDPDIIIFDTLHTLEDTLSRNSIVLTPHFYTPVFDQFTLTEQQMFVNGIYNLGFLAVKRSKDTEDFLHWWKIKLFSECYMDIEKGMFVDQLWCNMVPLYFGNVFIEKNPGYNMAYWNLHERTIALENGKYLANGVPLVFYHYSGIDIHKADGISRWQNRFDLNNRPDLREIFDSYRSTVQSNDYTYFRSFSCVYAKIKPPEKKRSLLKRALMSVTFRIYHFTASLPI